MSAERDEPLIDPLLLEVLLHAGEPMSVEALALRRGVPRRVILEELDRLRAVGCELDAHPQRGVDLVRAGLGAWRDYLGHALGVDRPIEVYARTSSTQDACRRLLAHRGAAGDGAIVAADAQSAGRGRLGRRWAAPPGATVAMSRACVLDAKAAASAVDRLTFAASVGVAEAVDALLEGRARAAIKWPNDVCVDERKVAGILVETGEAAPGLRAAIVGVGLNVSLDPAALAAHDPSLPGRVTSLAQHGARADRLLVLAHTAQALDRTLREVDVAPLLDAWRRRCTQLDRPIRATCDGRSVAGRVVDLDPHDGLILRTDAGELVHLPAAATTLETPGGTDQRSEASGQRSGGSGQPREPEPPQSPTSDL